jgi:predicted helicase
LKNAGLGGILHDKIRNHILKNFYGFEILITPYVISHLKLTDLLERWRFKYKEKDRIQIFLTNTLEPSEMHGLLPFLREINDENKTTYKIKMKDPVLVILGNPPYSGTSANQGKWINDLLKNGYKRFDGSQDDGYYKINGRPLDEKNPKWLQDDYVKFIRFAQWKIDMSGEGVIGYITNHSYLDNPTFRGMRESLLDSFSRIYILNLHGNLLKKEKSPDGSKDENVFDIRPGVSIVLFIKNNKFKDKKVFYADLYGKREDKYNWLDRHTINNVNWQEITPISPDYFFVPKDVSLLKKYEKYWDITEIFPTNSVGIVTSRDHFVIDFEKRKLRDRIESLRDNTISNEYLKNKYNLKDKSN